GRKITRKNTVISVDKATEASIEIYKVEALKITEEMELQKHTEKSRYVTGDFKVNYLI
ncbi:hypothetical protein NPIL_675771, partial [Nephila pilipes]